MLVITPFIQTLKIRSPMYLTTFEYKLSRKNYLQINAFSNLVIVK